MVKNPITSIIGILIALCPLVGGLYPELKAFCDQAIQLLIGAGFLTAADGVKTPGAVKVAGLGVGLFLAGSLLVGCGAAKQDLKQIEATLSNVAAGEYQVSITKDGKALLTEVWVCSADSGKLTGCHKR